MENLKTTEILKLIKKLKILKLTLGKQFQWAAFKLRFKILR